MLRKGDEVMGQCTCCQTNGVRIVAKHPPRPDGSAVELCELCESSQVGWIGEDAAREDMMMLRTTCYVGNEILKALKKVRSEIEEVKRKL